MSNRTSPTATPTRVSAWAPMAIPVFRVLWFAQLGSNMLRASGARVIRWVPLGGVVTMDFSPMRLTVQLDGANRVQSASCG